ncbi:helix-turn-helix domain-containing protein [Kineococcus gynurae]
MDPVDKEVAGAALLADYQAGASIRELATRYSFSIGRTRRLLVDAGVEFRPRGGGPRTQRSGSTSARP